MIKTTEACPTCKSQDATVRHLSFLGRRLHETLCPNCGESTSWVLWNCPQCGRVIESTQSTAVEVDGQ